MKNATNSQSNDLSQPYDGVEVETRATNSPFSFCPCGYCETPIACETKAVCWRQLYTEMSE